MFYSLCFSPIPPKAINSKAEWKCQNYTYSLTHTCTHACTHTHTHTCMHTCLHAHTCTHVRAQTHTHTHTWSHTYAHTHVHIHTHTCTHTHTHTHMYMHTHCTGILLSLKCIDYFVFAILEIFVHFTRLVLLLRILLLYTTLWWLNNAYCASK